MRQFLTLIVACALLVGCSATSTLTQGGTAKGTIDLVPFADGSVIYFRNNDTFAWTGVAITLNDKYNCVSATTVAANASGHVTEYDCVDEAGASLAVAPAQVPITAIRVVTDQGTYSTRFS